MRLFIFLKILRLQSFLILRQSLITFASIFYLLSPGYSQNPPSLSLEDPSPQLLLSLDDLMPNHLPSTPTTPDSAVPLLENFNKAHHPNTHRAEQHKEAEVSRLLKELKFCSNVNEAKIISQQLQHLWSQSGSETIDLLMLWAENAINADNYGLALDYIDNVLALFPTYAEAWIRRAWIHIQLSDFKLAMLDLSHALKIEPRNYIAFFELGVTMEATNRLKLAIKAYEMALHYYPQMRKIQKRIEVLLDKQSPQTL
ncbi:tetratricopeptide repeat protein [Bartonella sp. B35(2025)]